MKELIVLYRLSDNGYPKEKFSFATKIYCLDNSIKEFGIENIHLFIDEVNLKDETRNYINKIQQKFGHFEFYTAGSSAGSFRYVFNYALKNFDDEQIIFFVEDDYIFLPNVKNIILEGISISNYMTPYLHGDRFIPQQLGGNINVDSSGAYITRLCKTQNSFWTQIESTTMTFSTTIEQLKKDENIWRKHIIGTYPQDFNLFVELNSIGRTLICPIPTYGTHAEPRWQSPLIGTGVSSWENV